MMLQYVPRQVKFNLRKEKKRREKPVRPAIW